MKIAHTLSLDTAAALPAGRATAPVSAPAWLKSSILWLAWNSPLPWPESRVLQQRLTEADLTLPTALTLQQQLITRIHTHDAERKAQLRQRVAARIAQYPELFLQTSYGRQIAQSCLSTLQYEAAAWNELARLDHWTEVAVESWLDMNYRVEQALLDGEKMQSDMRKALRDPGTTQAQDEATVAQLAAQFQRGRESSGNYLLLDAARRLFELLLDATDPKPLATALVRQLASAA